MAEKKIRHLPVKDIETGHLIGIVSQKALLANALRVIKQRGFDQLEHTEKSVDVGTIMESTTISYSSDTEVSEVARALQKLRSGCIAIVDQNKLVGVVTSSDFVKLAAGQ